MKFLCRILPPAAAWLAFPLVAQAHPGHDGHDFAWDFSSGFTHPLTGWDHLLAMVAIGLWAAQVGGRVRWLIPAAFVAAMAAGAALGRSGIGLPGIEQGIATSLLVLGLLIVRAVRLPLWAGMGLAAVFAGFHGFAHGAEAHAVSSGLQYDAGFIAATAMLHLAGIGLGTALGPRRVAVQVAGGLIAGAGVLAVAIG